jgi:hypothetical protein
VAELFKVIFQKFTLTETFAEEIISQAPLGTVIVGKKYPVRRNSWENEWLLLKNANSLKSTD